LATEHGLKTWPRHFQAIWVGEKAFEFRYDDRHYKVGDILYLKEWVPQLTYNENHEGYYTGREIKALVTYKLGMDEEQPEFVPDDWVIMSIKAFWYGVDGHD
jgi:hypothetical protein